MKNQICKKVVNENGTVTFNFGNGESVEVGLNDFNTDIQNRLIAYGISQKLGDAYSGCKGDADKAFEMFQKTLDGLMGDDATWTTRTASGGSARPTMIVEAIARFKQIDLSDAADLVDSLDKEQLKAVRSAPQIQAILAQIKVERAQEKLANSESVDLSELL